MSWGAQPGAAANNQPGGVWGGGGSTGGPGINAPASSGAPNSQTSPGWGTSQANMGGPNPQYAGFGQSGYGYPYGGSQAPGGGAPYIYGSNPMGANPWMNASTMAGFAPLPGGGPRQPPQGQYPAPAASPNHGSTPSSVDWSQAPIVDPGQYAGGANKQLWQKDVGIDENWIQQEEGRGARITGAVPGMFQGDIGVLNRYGTFGNNLDTQNNKEWVPSTSGTPDPKTGQLGYWRPMNQSTIDTINNYQNFAYNEENKPGGGAVNAWGQYQGYGPNTAGNDWGGAYSAYMANQAINAGVAPGAGYGFGTTAASSPLGYGPGGTFYNMGSGGAQYFNQYGIPISGPGGGGQGGYGGGYPGYPPPMGYSLMGYPGY